MNRRFGRLPPLTSLEGFEASARLKSFSLASEELHITQSAVSHQIKALEAFFGIPLFNRSGRSVELTVAGMELLETVTEALDQLSRGKRRMDSYFRPGSVVLGCSSAFAGKWLLPRYNSLLGCVEGIQPWLYTEDEIFDLKTQEVDLAIWFGDGNWPGLESTKLFHDRLTPMYAAAKFPKKRQLRQVDDLKDHTLLHVEQRDDWLSWFHSVGQPELDTVKGCNFSSPSLALDCAVDGNGVALGSFVLASDLIAAEHLQLPFEQMLESREAYYLVHDAEQGLRPHVEQTKEWLLEQAVQFNEGQDRR